jgi:hypothetical protein
LNSRAFDLIQNFEIWEPGLCFLAFSDQISVFYNLDNDEENIKGNCKYFSSNWLYKQVICYIHIKNKIKIPVILKDSIEFFKKWQINSLFSLNVICVSIITIAVDIL